MRNAMETILKHFKGDIRSVLGKITESDYARCHEIRLRVDRSLSVFCSNNENYIVEKSGVLKLPGSFNNGITVTAADIKYCFESLCDYSVHSFQKEIKSGFITVKGGHRAGFCGTSVSDNFNAVFNIKNISSVNFRIAREVKGSAEEISKRLFSGFKTPSVLICGEVGSGKTTILRDLSRILGNREKVSLIDTRGELAAVCDGVPALDTGLFTDVFDGYGKSAGIDMAVRVMSPRIIICDEIGDNDDVKALRKAKLSGVSVAASAHAKNLDDLYAKNIVQNIFDYAVFIKNAKISELSEVKV
jgi:stage III sporulation protein AA